MIQDYDLEIEKIKKIIEEKRPKTVLIQLPDGLKPLANKIVDDLQTEGTEIYIWAGTCFGACDIPNVEFDLLVQFGHSEFK